MQTLLRTAVVVLAAGCASSDPAPDSAATTPAEDIVPAQDASAVDVADTVVDTTGVPVDAAADADADADADGDKPSVDEGCVPDCGDRTCGDDGCGGSCGECDDGLECTADTCDAFIGCYFTLSDGFCLIDGVCVTSGDRLGETGDDACKRCIPASSADSWSNEAPGYPCSDGGFCDGLTFVIPKACGNGNGICEDVAIETECDAPLQGCELAACDDILGCITTTAEDGTPCGADGCIGDIWHEEGSCAAGDCVSKTQDCDEPDNQCRDGYCAADGCAVQALGPTTKCTSGSSGQCVGNTWHPPDYCSGKITGECIDSGSQNCDASDTGCTDYYCNGGCQSTTQPTSKVCVAASCADGCTQQAAIKCNGAGACASGGAQTSCGGNLCSGGSCTSSCSANSDCCDTDGNNRTCIGGQCNNRQGCKGACDPGDSGDCMDGTCVNCKEDECQTSKGTGHYCYKTKSQNDVCGSGKTCWHCGDV